MKKCKRHGIFVRNPKIMATETLADYGYFCLQTHSAVSIMGSRPSAQFPSLELEDEPGPH